MSVGALFTHRYFPLNFSNLLKTSFLFKIGNPHISHVLAVTKYQSFMSNSYFMSGYNKSFSFLVYFSSLPPNPKFTQDVKLSQRYVQLNIVLLNNLIKLKVLTFFRKLLTFNFWHKFRRTFPWKLFMSLLVIINVFSFER